MDSGEISEVRRLGRGPADRSGTSFCEVARLINGACPSRPPKPRTAISQPGSRPASGSLTPGHSGLTGIQSAGGRMLCAARFDGGTSAGHRIYFMATPARPRTLRADNQSGVGAGNGSSRAANGSEYGAAVRAVRAGRA